MDLKQYFKKIKDLEETMTVPYPLIVSLETADGGKAGVVVEVSRYVAAKSIIDKRAELASDEQAKAYYAGVSERKRAAEKAELASRLQIAIISDSDLQEAKSTLRKKEEPKG